ncbi:MAG: ABC transporter ATP-binding protein [Pseudomonadota bacterium]
MASTILETRDASKHFDGLIAVDRVCYQLAEGETAGIIGPNGAGKSTFFNLLTGYYPPDQGQIFYQGREVTRQPAWDRVNSGLVRTFQLVSVFESMSVLENMMLARIRQGRAYTSRARFFLGLARKGDLVDECLGALELMGLQDRAEAPASGLSYGEKRLLEIAIALSLKPQVLLLDEPFAGLSLVEIAQISEVVMALKGRFAIAIVEHKISKLMDLVDRLSVINEGALVCSGDPQTVICDPLVRECYWGKEDMVCY